MSKTTIFNSIPSGLACGTVSVAVYAVFSSLQATATGVPVGVASYKFSIIALLVLGAVFGTVFSYRSGRKRDAEREKREAALDEVTARRVARLREIDNYFSQDPA